MKSKISGIEGADVYIDDILIWGRTDAEHNERLEKHWENEMNTMSRLIKKNQKYVPQN